MLHAIIADIHGNSEALGSVLADLETLGESCRVVCLGDLIGYGADPNECVERVRELTDTIVAGNHDYAAVGLTDVAYFNPHAREAICWTRQALSGKNVEVLQGLPLTMEKKEALFVHATPADPGAWDYMTNAWEARSQFAHFLHGVCFVGHSHVPMIAVLGPRGFEFVSDRTIHLEEGWRFIINVGSVGQPRDRDPRAAYALYDDEGRTVGIKRVAYDIEGARAKILAAGLPRILADRLRSGE